MKMLIQHTWKKLDSFPLIFAVILAIGIFVPCIIALSNGHVTPYIPYISEGGGEFPEAGIFSLFICLSAFLCQWIFIIRYLVVEQLNVEIGNDMNIFLNKISFALGGFSSVALIVVASFPASTITQVHNSAAGASCVCYVIYLICQTLISFQTLGRTIVSYFRLTVTIISALLLLFITTFGLIGSSVWTSEYWAGKKTPQDKGFVYYLVSSSSEWIFTFLLLLFFSTYISEFKKSNLHFHVEINTTRNKPRLRHTDFEHQ